MKTFGQLHDHCWVHRAAATALAQRHADGSLPLEDFNIELEDQSGKKVNLGSDTDQRLVIYLINNGSIWSFIPARVSKTLFLQGGDDGLDASHKRKATDSKAKVQGCLGSAWNGRGQLVHVVIFYWTHLPSETDLLLGLIEVELGLSYKLHAFL